MVCDGMRQKVCLEWQDHSRHQCIFFASLSKIWEQLWDAAADLSHLLGIFNCISSDHALGFAYFLLAWLVWRYQLCYVFIRAYESGALLFPALFSRIMISLLLYQMFMSFYLLIKAAFVPAFVLWIIVPPFLWSFHSHCTRCFMMKSVYLPLAIAKEMPARRFSSGGRLLRSSNASRIQRLGIRGGQSVAGLWTFCSKICLASRLLR